MLELARKVRYETKEYASYPAAFPGGVRITLKDGRTVEADFPHQLGAPENPMSAEQVREKFHENAAHRRRVFDPRAGRSSRSRNTRTCAGCAAGRTSRSRREATGRRAGFAEQREIIAAVREWVEREVYPAASEYEHADEFPEPLVEQMRELGLFGVTIPEEYGGLGLDLTTYALIQVELSRGWMSPVGRPEHALHLGVDDQDATAPRSSASTSCRGWRPARCAPPTR